MSRNLRSKSLGRSGEEKAKNFLLARGYTILDSNWENEIGELDIIARHKGYIIFIEVHLAEKYNELYSTTINLSNEKCISNFNLTFVPEKYSKATRDHLSDVNVTCK